MIDSAWLGLEIYDLLPVDGVSRWPLGEPPDSDRELLTELWSAFDSTSRRMRHALQLSAKRKRQVEEARQAFRREREKAESAAREMAAKRTLAKGTLTKGRRHKAARIAAELAQLLRSPAASARSAALDADEAAAGGTATPPLVIVGIGGSGTRVFAQLAVAGGCFMGANVNGSNDALEFYELADRWCEPVHRTWVAGAGPPDLDGFALSSRSASSAIERAPRARRRGVGSSHAAFTCCPSSRPRCPA